jgi:NitT/TauT family transport system permease protein
MVGGTTLAGPTETFARLWVLAARAGFRADVADTAVAFVLSAAISVGAGVLLGCLLGLSRLLGRVVEPVLSSFYALPKVTLYPVVLLLFGLGFSAKVAFGVMHGLTPIVLVTMHAVLQVRPVHLRTARAMRLGVGQTIRAVVLPSILPEVLGGVRIGVPLALLGVLIGEMFASRRGLGSVAMRAMEANDGATLLAVAVLASAAALGVNAGLRRLVGRQP